MIYEQLARSQFCALRGVARCVCWNSSGGYMVSFGVQVRMGVVDPSGGVAASGRAADDG